MIIAAGVVAPYFAKPGLVLAIGVFVAGFVQLVAQFPALRTLGLLPRPRWDRAHEGVRRIARLMLPGIFGSSVAQVSLLLDTVDRLLPDDRQHLPGCTTRTAWSSFRWACSRSRSPP